MSLFCASADATYEITHTSVYILVYIKYIGTKSVLTNLAVASQLLLWWARSLA